MDYRLRHLLLKQNQMKLVGELQQQQQKTTCDMHIKEQEREKNAQRNKIIKIIIIFKDFDVEYVAGDGGGGSVMHFSVQTKHTKRNTTNLGII